MDVRKVAKRFKMPSKFARQALKETPLEIRQKVIKYGNEMENLQELAEEHLAKTGIEDRILNREDLPEYWQLISNLMADFAAKLAAEDKKELLEALKRLLKMSLYSWRNPADETILTKVKKVVEKHETI